ncbi:MAG: DinB family protein [Thermomicrobiales bacterium]
MIPFAAATDHFLTKLAADALRQLDGIPERDLNEWRPALGLQDVNTLYGLATHLVAAGEFWMLHAAAGRPTDRDRPAEFRASGDLATLQARYGRWLDECRAVLSELAEADLDRRFQGGSSQPVDWSVAECIMHAVEHTAVHVGHLQLQRQIWNAERIGAGG